MRRARAGFTLLELLIAIALFALLGLATYRMLEAVLRSDEVVGAQEAQLRELGRALWSLERDLLQAVPRPIRDEYGDERNAFIGQLASPEEGVAFELTRSGWRNPTGLPRANLQRVRWRLTDDTLERLYWVVLDRDIESQPRVQRVLPGVTEWRLRYLDSDRAWHEEWPPFTFGRSDPEQQARRLPAAVEVSFEHPRFGTISRLLRLPENAAPPAFVPPAPPQGTPGESQGEPPVSQEPSP